MKIETLGDFITQMPITLNSTLEKARYMYLELGKRSFYDRKFEHMMFEEELEYYYKSKSYSNPNMIICTTLIKQYKELLDGIGIKSSIIKVASGHSFLEIEDEKGVKHKTDLTRDLKNIQFGCSTSYFARDTIDTNILRKIDLNLGYITENKGYSNDYWYILRDKLNKQNISSQRRLEIILQSLQGFGDLSKLGESELFSLYQKFTRYCANKKDDIVFYTRKIPNNPEEFFITLTETTRKITYKLNKATLQFDLYEEKAIEEQYK